MRPALTLLCYALTALRGVEATFQVTYASQATFQKTSAGARLIPVLVGGPLLTFTPNSVTASPGDVIQFQFAARNHTVTQSAQSSPCRPLDSSGNGTAGVHSGFIPFDGGASGTVGTFDVPVRDASPMFLYCAQATHCQSGMVMVVNAPSADLINYATSATSATSNTPAKQVAGGIAASIPLSNALVPLASSSPPTATATASRQTQTQTTSSSSSSSSSTSTTSTQDTTLTVTRASTNIATATVTGRPSLVGGGTSTATATTVVVVGPSGIAAATASGGGTRAGVGVDGVGGNNGTGAASPTDQPVAAVPFTFTGAAGARARGDAASALSMLMGVGAAALGSSLLVTAARR